MTTRDFALAGLNVGDLMTFARRARSLAVPCNAREVALDLDQRHQRAYRALVRSQAHGREWVQCPDCGFPLLQRFDRAHHAYLGPLRCSECKFRSYRPNGEIGPTFPAWAPDQ